LDVIYKIEKVIPDLKDADDILQMLRGGFGVEPS
jgi:hypothetical protein